MNFPIDCQKLRFLFASSKQDMSRTDRRPSIPAPDLKVSITGSNPKQVCSQAFSSTFSKVYSKERAVRMALTLSVACQTQHYLQDCWDPV